MDTEDVRLPGGLEIARVRVGNHHIWIARHNLLIN
jgi:hypothetical protein